MDDSITIQITKEQYSVICTALGKLPLEVSGQTYSIINQQVAEQLQEAAKLQAVPDAEETEAGQA